jgi:hypothetical protein
MKTINRTVVTISPKQPYLDWANSFEDGSLELDSPQIYSTALFLPDKYDEHNFEDFIKKVYDLIFEQKLELRMVTPNNWPENRSYKKFNEWFDVRIIDLDTAPVFAE